MRLLGLGWMPLGILNVPLFFLAGAMISAYFVDRRFHRGLQPRYATVMGLVAACLLGAAVAGKAGFFGEFGDPVDLDTDYVLLALLCMASGLQNAAITTSSGFAVRTTHLTGITTDLAIGLVRAGSIDPRSQKFAIEVRTNFLPIGTILSFMFGSVVGVALFFKPNI